MPATVRVNIGDGYSVKIRRGVISNLGPEVLKLDDELEKEILLITDEKVSGLYLKKVIMNFNEYPKPEGTTLRVCELIIEGNEGTKNFQTLSKILEEMAGLGLTKKCCVIALGGGVVCDAAGFAAGCYQGGVKLVLVPTTLAAMIEASVGGSAFLNLNAGKNLAGMKCNPSVVICDTDTLATLTHDEYQSGIAEAFKTAVMCGPELFNIFERGEEAVKENIEKIIEGCIKFRAALKNQDRAKCIGYEICNAIESRSGYKIYHGAALASGLEIITRAAFKMNWCSENTFQKIMNAMKKNNLAAKKIYRFNAGAIAQTILNGRGILGGRTLELSVPVEIGRCELKQIRDEELENILALGMNL
ncbi:MAG: 3-dehydroquinate synthase [Synergistaceae bacterium]|nr:3-dehydroquinate synthase [Synergistaceae bacterium]